MRTLQGGADRFLRGGEGTSREGKCLSRKKVKTETGWKREQNRTQGLDRRIVWGKVAVGEKN